MTTNIYLIRHGEVHNPKKIVYGMLPGFKLTPKGEKEIKQSANFLADKNIEAVYSSPLLRARQTASIIQKALNLQKVYFTRYLLEMNSSAEGELGAKLDLVHHDYYSPPIWHPGDDTMDSISNRMNTIINKLFKKYHGKSVVAVSHGDPILILKAFIKSDPMKLSSIRHEKYDIEHGEILQIKKTDSKKATVQSVFIPKI
ncbi:MAG TPA: histidine phosphatase family protein [Candidatus Saccharimonadales bacterium]|nr:histidine phosphatase family protein [Candidatus Saccharimonadales bacterium]